MTLNNEKIERITDCTIDRKDGNIEFAEMKNSRFCAVVSECDFSGSEFGRTNLRGNSFVCSDMSGAYFEEVNLSGAGFERSDIGGAGFTDVNLHGAAIDCCDLSGVEFTDCRIDGMKIKGYDISELIEFYKNNHKENG